MENEGTIYYLNNDKDFIAFVEEDTREITSILNPVSAIKRENRDLERGFKLLEGEKYVICENGIKKYCFLKDEELILF